MANKIVPVRFRLTGGVDLQPLGMEIPYFLRSRSVWLRGGTPDTSADKHGNYREFENAAEFLRIASLKNACVSLKSASVPFSNVPDQCVKESDLPEPSKPRGGEGGGGVRRGSAPLWATSLTATNAGFRGGDRDL